MRNGPQMLSLCRTQNERLCHRTSWRNIPGIFLPLTVQLTAHVCLESAASGARGAENIVVSQLLETMKKVRRHLMEPKGRNLGQKRMQVLDVFISRQQQKNSGDLLEKLFLM